MVHQSTGDLLSVVVRERQPKIRLSPEIVAHQSEGVAEGGAWLGVPGSTTDGAGLPLKQLVGQQGDQGEEAEEGGGGASNGLVRPLTLALDPQMRLSS